MSTSKTRRTISGSLAVLVLLLASPAASTASVKPKLGAWTGKLKGSAEVHLWLKDRGGVYVGIDQGEACALDPLGQSATNRIPLGKGLAKARFDKRLRISAGAISYTGPAVSDAPNMRGALEVPSMTISGRFTSRSTFSGRLSISCAWKGKDEMLAGSFVARYLRPSPPNGSRPVIFGNK